MAQSERRLAQLGNRCAYGDEVSAGSGMPPNYVAESCRKLNSFSSTVQTIAIDAEISYISCNNAEYSLI